MGKAKRAAKKAAKKEKKAIKKASPKTKKKLGKFLAKAGKKLKATGQNAVFAPLLPFKKAMVKRLAEKNITHDNSIHDVAIKFTKNIVGVSHFEEMEFEALYADAKSGGSSLASAAVAAGTGDYAGAAGNLIKAIVNYFKKIRDKKKAGQELTAEEKDSLAEADKASEEILLAEDADDESGYIAGIQEWIKENKFLVIGILGAGAVLFFVFKKK